MDLSDTPTWSKSKLNKLGKSLLSGDGVPAGCPTYDEVMLWHANCEDPPEDLGATG